MKPTDILSHEHRFIEQVLNCLEKMAHQCASEGTLDKEPAKDAVAFFRMFADRCHHGKEEVHLFPAMEAKGFSREGGPTGVMLAEHEQGRSHVRAMDDAIDAAAAGDPQAVRRFIAHAQGYIELLREHIQKEDHCLFPMADQAFSQDDQQRLAAVFEKVEAEELGEGTHQTYLQIANQLAERFGVPRAAAHGTASRGSGCGH